QIIDRSAIRPHLTALDEPGPNRVLLNVMPFLSVIFTRSKVPIKIFRLPDGRFDRECCCNPSRTYALPHLHPVRYAPCADLGPHKRSSVRGRAVSMIALVHHNNEPRGALILTLSRSRRDRNLRANSTAPGVSP